MTVNTSDPVRYGHASLFALAIEFTCTMAFTVCVSVHTFSVVGRYVALMYDSMAASSAVSPAEQSEACVLPDAAMVMVKFFSIGFVSVMVVAGAVHPVGL